MYEIKCNFKSEVRERILRDLKELKHHALNIDLMYKIYSIAREKEPIVIGVGRCQLQGVRHYASVFTRNKYVEKKGNIVDY